MKAKIPIQCTEEQLEMITTALYTQYSPDDMKKAFRKLYPDISYTVQIVPEITDDNGNEMWGETIFTDEMILISISGKLTILDAIEIFAHELAHAAIPDDFQHGDEWEKSFDDIFNEYEKLLAVRESDRDRRNRKENCGNEIKKERG